MAAVAAFCCMYVCINWFDLVCFPDFCRRDVLQEIVNMQNYEGVFLPVALRYCFLLVLELHDMEDMCHTLAINDQLTTSLTVAQWLEQLIYWCTEGHGGTPLRDSDISLSTVIALLNYTSFLICSSFCFRQFFERVYPPDQRGEFLDTLLNKFSVQFCATNPTTSFTPGKNITCVVIGGINQFYLAYRMGAQCSR